MSWNGFSGSIVNPLIEDKETLNQNGYILYINFLFFNEIQGTHLANLAFNPDYLNLHLIVCIDIS